MDCRLLLFLLTVTLPEPGQEHERRLWREPEQIGMDGAWGATAPSRTFTLKQKGAWEGVYENGGRSEYLPAI